MSDRERRILIFLVVVSLALNALLLIQWWVFQQQLVALRANVQQALAQGVRDLQTFEQTPVRLNVHIKQDIPVRLSLPLPQGMSVPVQAAIPISEAVKTTISANVLGMNLPINVTVPISMSVPVSLSVPLPFTETLAVSTTVPLDADLPITLNLSDTELGGYLQRLRTTLSTFEQSLGAVGQ